MTRRPRVALAVAVAAVAAASALLPSAASAEFTCPDGWYYKPTSIKHPTTGNPISYCWPMS